MCPVRYRTGGSLLHCLSTLTKSPAFHRNSQVPVCHKLLAVYFCCTGLGVASTGCYPASCPVKPGLSSPVNHTQAIGLRTILAETAAIIYPTWFLNNIIFNIKWGTINPHYSCKEPRLSQKCMLDWRLSN